MSAAAILNAIAVPLAPSPMEIPGCDRQALAEAFAVLGFKLGAEIGVEEGKYSETLLHAIPGLTLRLVDPWLAYPGYRERLDQAYVDGLYDKAMARLAPWFGQLVVHRLPSIEAARQVPDGSLDFVYIDANHCLEHVIKDLAAWTPKVRKGGIVSGHDWIRMRRSVEEPIHVQAAVEAWTECYRIEPWFVLGLKGEKRPERARSWFWVKA